MIGKAALAAVALLAILAPGTLLAQGQRAWFVNPHVGVLAVSDEGLQNLDGEGSFDGEIDPSVLLGARVGVRLTDSWKLEAAFATSPITASIEELEDFEIDGDVQLFYGALNYHLPHQGALGVFLSAGAGAARVSFDDTEIFGETIEGESFSDFLLDLGGGFGWELTPIVALRGDLRDHMTFCKGIDEDSDDEEGTLCPAEDQVLHNFEVSGGLSIRLGGR